MLMRFLSRFAAFDFPRALFQPAPQWRPGRISGVRKARRAAQQRRNRRARAA